MLNIDKLKIHQNKLENHSLLIENHISTYDFPETQTTLYQLAQKHNFVRFECLYKDTFESAQFLCLYK
jgi:hypothetical protein